MDALSTVLSTIHFTDILYCRAELSAPWGLVTHKGRTVFVLVLSGECVFEGSSEIGEQVTIALRAGDFLMSQVGTNSSVKDNRESSVVDLATLLQDEPEKLSSLIHGGGGTRCTVILGCFESDMAPSGLSDLLFRSLPSVLLLTSENMPSEPWLLATFKFLAAELEGKKPGSESVITHLTDLLFIQAIRAYVSQQNDTQRVTGLLKALSDPALATVLNSIHASPEKGWSVESMAKTANLSRSVFAARFSSAMSCSPFEYLTLWRVQMATQFLREGASNLSEFAARVGYQSETVFRRAFTRIIGESPASYKRSLQKTLSTAP